MKRNLTILIILSLNFCAYAQKVDSLLAINESSTPFVGSNISFHLLYRTFQLKKGRPSSVYAQGKALNSIAYQGMLYEIDWQYWSPDDSSAVIDTAFAKINGNLINDTHTFFYKNGKEMSKGPYVRGKRFGKWTSWYVNGEIKSEGHYFKDFKIGMWHKFYSNGQLYSVESYITDTNFINAILRDGIAKHVKYRADDAQVLKDNLRMKQLFSGVSKWYYPIGQECSEEFWDIVMLNSQERDENGNFYKVKDRNRYKNFRPAPHFKGDLYYFIKKRLHLSVSEKRTIGKMAVSFILTSTGEIKGISVLSPTNEIEKAKIKQAIEEMQGKWTVAKTHNIPRTTKITLTIYLT